jgi:hypothetical protein
MFGNRGGVDAGASNIDYSFMNAFELRQNMKKKDEEISYL